MDSDQFLKTCIPPEARAGQPKWKISELREQTFLSSIVHKVGHEIGNPLTSIISLATVLHRYDGSSDGTSGNDPKFSEYLDAISQEAWRVSSTVEKLVLLFSDRQGSSQPCSVERCIANALKKIKRKPEYANATVEVRKNVQGATVYSDTEQFTWLVGALIENGIQATHRNAPDRRTLPVTCSATQLGPWSLIEITNFRDTPCSLSLSELFDPFVVETQQAKFLGLGLTTAAAIVERFGGQLALSEREVDGITQVTAHILLPNGDAANTENSHPTIDPHNGKSGREQLALLPKLGYTSLNVAIIEDDPVVASVVQKILEFCFNEVLPCKCAVVAPKEFLAQLSGKPDYDLILCDLNLGEISGRFLYQRLGELHPALKNGFIFLTGDQNRHEAQVYLNSCQCPHLFKPFEAEHLIAIVAQTLLKKRGN